MIAADLILDAEIKKHRTPSVQYYFFNRHAVIHQFSKGLADVASGRMVDAGTTYHAFSVTKTFTALAIMQLVEKGILYPDTPVVKYLKDFPYGDQITVRQLLCHTSGIPNPVPLGWIHPVSAHDGFDSKAFFKSVFAKHPRVRTQPNAKFAYSNLGYVLLGQLIEAQTSMAYETYIAKNILEKLSLEASELGFHLPDPSRMATGYFRDTWFNNQLLRLFIDRKTYLGNSAEGWKSFNPYYVNGAAYGGLTGTPAAFVKYIQALLQVDAGLLSQPYKLQLFKENATNKNWSTGMSLSWFTGTLKRHHYYAHAGGGGGYYCEIRIYPDAGRGSVIFFNRSGMKDERFLDKTDIAFLETA